jgi:predicted MFS family arabinose efflux permease
MRFKFDGLWRHPDFTRLWAGQTISIFGSLVGRTALPFTAILVLDAGPIEIAALSVAELAPALLLGPAIGVWVDRLRRRPILITSDVGRFLLLATIPIAHLFDALTMQHLYAVAFLVGILTMFFDVAYLSYLPSLVKREELLEGNSKLAASSSVAEVTGFSLSGWLVQLVTGPVTILIDAVSFLFSALAVATIGTPEPPPRPGDQRPGIRQEFGEGVRFLLDDAALRALAAAAVTLELSWRLFGAVFLVFVTKDLGFTPGVLGMIFAVGGVSSLVGAMVAQRSARKFGAGPSMWGGLVFMGVSMMFIPVAPEAGLVAATLLVAQQLIGDGGATVFEVNQVSLRQSLTPERMLGRVNAAIRLSSLAAMLLGSLAGGVMGETLGLRVTLVAGACATLAAAGCVFFSRARWLRGPGEVPEEALVEAELEAGTPLRPGTEV